MEFGTAGKKLVLKCCVLLNINFFNEKSNVDIEEGIELFARNNFKGRDNWGVEIPDSKVDIITGLTNSDHNEDSDGQLSINF